MKRGPMSRFAVTLLIALLAAVAVACGGGEGGQVHVSEPVVQIAIGTGTSQEFVATVGGSGTIIDSDGLILTNFHIVDPEQPWDSIAIYTVDDPKRPPQLSYFAAIAAFDANLDIAVLKIVADSQGKLMSVSSLPTATLGDSDSVEAGDKVRILGFPDIGGDTLTVTQGIVSGFVSDPSRPTQPRWMKTDAELSNGNSGGAALNELDELVGIPTGIVVGAENPTALGQLLPVNLAFDLLVEAREARTSEYITHGAGGRDLLRAEQEFRLRIAGDPSTLDPQLASFAEEISVVKQLFRGLFAYDEELNVVPAVALEVPTKENGGVSEDGLTYTINLREDATWSDGTRVTAHDFVYAFQRLFDPDAGAQGYYFDFYTVIDGAEDFAYGEGSAEAVNVSAYDDYTLQIQLTHEQPTLPTLLALWPASPLRRDVIEQHGDSWTEPGNLIGNGPFVLAAYTPEERIVLEANPAYWGDDQPTLQRLVYRIIPEDSSALIAYQNGELDMTSIPLADSARFQGDPEQVRYAELETFAIQYNHQAAPFDNPLVRRAFSRAIDRNAYVQAVRSGVGAPALSWLPPGMPGANASLGRELGFDVDAARALLAEAGYPDGEGFPDVTFTIADDPSNRLTAEFLQEQLRQNLGIDLQIETLEEGAFFDRFFEGDFQVTWLSWFADYADPENWLPEQFGTEGGFNVLGYSNPQVDELFAQAALELDQAERLALYDQAHRIIIEDQAVTPIFHPERNFLVKAHVAGLTTTALDAEPGDWFVSSVRILETETGGAPPASLPDEEPTD